MFQKSFVVLAFPRTGSTLIIGNLNAYFSADVLQTHRSDFVPAHDDYTCIITKRNNVFETMCSHFIMNVTNESSFYTSKHVDPIKVHPEEMRSLLSAHKRFHQTRNLSYYKKVIEIDFDQLIDNPYYLFAQFNIVQRTNYMIKQSPYRYQDLIVNIDELQQVYQDFCQQQ